MALSWGIPIYLLTEDEDKSTDFDDTTNKLGFDEINEILAWDWNGWDVVAAHLGCKAKIEKFYYMIW